MGKLAFDPPAINFGHFEAGKAPPVKLTVLNTGTMAISFKIKRSDPLSASVFALSRVEGTLLPDRSCEIIVLYTKEDGEALGVFEEELYVETDLVGSFQFLKVFGHCDSSVVDPEQFKPMHMGYCLVGEPTSKTFEIENSGGFPLDVQLKPDFPLKVHPKAASIPGHDKLSFSVKWIPSGGFQMRSNITISTNIGVFPLRIEGRGDYPQFILRDARCDFGTCAVDVEYKRRFTIVNVGKVPVRWNIPAASNGFSFSKTEGILAPKEERRVTLVFCPTEVGKYAADFIVEAKGRYRIINATGVGGRVGLQLRPGRMLDFEQCACGGTWSKPIPLQITNTGDVQLLLRFAAPETSSSLVSVRAEGVIMAEGRWKRAVAAGKWGTAVGAIHTVEEEAVKGEGSGGNDRKEDVGSDSDSDDDIEGQDTLLLGPRETQEIQLRAQVGLFDGNIGMPFGGTLRIFCREGAWGVRFGGLGIRVQLSADSARLIQSELLPGTFMPSPLERDKSVGKVGEQLERDRVTIHQVLQSSVRAVEASAAGDGDSLLQNYKSIQAYDYGRRQSMGRARTRRGGGGAGGGGGEGGGEKVAATGGGGMFGAKAEASLLAARGQSQLTQTCTSLRFLPYTRALTAFVRRAWEGETETRARTKEQLEQLAQFDAAVEAVTTYEPHVPRMRYAQVLKPVESVDTLESLDAVLAPPSAFDVATAGSGLAAQSLVAAQHALLLKKANLFQAGARTKRRRW